MTDHAYKHHRALIDGAPLARDPWHVRFWRSVMEILTEVGE